MLFPEIFNKFYYFLTNFYKSDRALTILRVPVRELTRITAIGSCRISTPFKAAPLTHPVVNNTARIYGYTHTSAETLQQIRFLQGEFTPPAEILPLLTPNVDIEALSDAEHPTSDIYFIELSSAKELRIAGTQVQLNYATRHFADFFADKHRARDFWRLADGRQDKAKLTFLNEQESYQTLNTSDQQLLQQLTRTLATPESLSRDLTEIRDRLPNVTFLTHCNALAKNHKPIASRAAYIAMVEDAAKTLNLPVFNPTTSMQAFGQHAAMSDAETSLSHYSEDFGNFLFDGLFETFIAPDHTCVLTPSAALSQALLQFQHRSPVTSISPHIGGVAFITGSLGAGGAERQMTRLAVEMKRAQSIRDTDQIGITGPVEVFVSTLSPARGRDFFLPQLQNADIPVSVISTLPAGPSTVPENLFRFLPPQTAEAVRRLTPHLSAMRPEVAYIWQDGAVLATALAALNANIPHIVISLRGMPPDLRPEMMKDEYFDMYCTLAKIPGVTFSANTHAGADAYARWLNLPADTIRVVHNAAETIATNGTNLEHKRWEAFAKSTPDADFTFGAVFRFDQNKRPHMWLEFAAAAMVAHPCSRFVLVGDGSLLSAAQTYAKELGIAHRCLFVGKSRNVGYWLSKMDALGLTSRLEGLPNVLIEAQLSGIPVISTPAGGAAEAFIPNQTGFLLGSTEQPQLAQFLGYFLTLATNKAQRETMGKAATAYASDTFAMDSILPKTLQLLSGASAADIPHKTAARA